LYSEPVGFPAFHKHEQAGQKFFCLHNFKAEGATDNPNLIKLLIKARRMMTLHLLKSFRMLSLTKKKFLRFTSSCVAVSSCLIFLQPPGKNGVSKTYYFYCKTKSLPPVCKLLAF